MARLNVDDEWFITDPRRPKLIALVGQFAADGMAVAGWRLAQPYWRKGKQPIPEDKWSISGLEPLVEVGLARRVEGGVYVCGTRDFANWLVKRVDAGREGGRKSGETRRKDNESKQKQARRSKTKQDEANESKSNPLTPSPVLSPALVPASPSGKSPDSAPPPPDAPPSGKKFTDWDLASATWLQRAIQLHNPAAIHVRRAKLDDWADVFRLMRERDGLDPPVIEHALFALFGEDHPHYIADPFWRKQIQSAATFREKWDRITAEINNPPKQARGGFR